MKQILKIIGIITLLIGSFIYTKQVTTVLKSEDNIMITIKNEAKMYYQSPVQALIENNTIIPGIKGRKVNANKSYYRMKSIGKYQQKLLVFEDIAPNISLKNNFDKYIIKGNPNKKMVSLVFIVKNNNLNKIIQILNNKGIKANFFIETKYLEKNKNIIFNLIKQNHIIGNLSTNYDYNNSDFIWIKSTITNGVGQKYNYCYAKEQNDDVIKNCSIQRSYTIMPTIITENPYISTKQNLESGSILSYEINSELEKELNLIINYIQSKNYQIVNLYHLLKE